MPSATLRTVVGVPPVEAHSLPAQQQWVLALMDQHGARLVQMLWRILGSEQDVLDAYQECFCRLLQLPAGQQLSNRRAYLFSLAANLAVDMLRRRRTATTHRDDYARSRHGRPGDPSPPVQCDQRELVQSMRENITRLPRPWQQVLLLHDLAELKYHQIASQLGISVGTARVYRCKAIRALARLMKHADRSG